MERSRLPLRLSQSTMALFISSELGFGEVDKSATIVPSAERHAWKARGDVDVCLQVTLNTECTVTCNVYLPAKAFGAKCFLELKK